MRDRVSLKRIDPSTRLIMSQLDPSTQYNRKLGLILFAAYSIVYLAFTLVSAFSPDTSKWKPLGGINLTTWWGLGLIVLAFVMSMVYGLMCRNEQAGPSSSKESSR